MRLMNTSASLPWVHPSEMEPATIPNPAARGPKDTDYQAVIPNPRAGEPLPDATVWLLRALSSREEGALQDAIYDLSRTTASQGKDGDAKVNMNVSISPSNLKRHRARLGIVGWSKLYDHAGEEIPFALETDGLRLGANLYTAVPETIMDAMPQSLIFAIASQIEKLSSVTPAQGN